MMLGENTHGVIGVGGGKYAKPLLRQLADDDIAHARFVFDEENGESRCCHDATDPRKLTATIRSTLRCRTSANNRANPSGRGEINAGREAAPPGIRRPARP